MSFSKEKSPKKSRSRRRNKDSRVNNQAPRRETAGKKPPRKAKKISSTSNNKFYSVHPENDYNNLAQQFPDFKVYHAPSCFSLNFQTLNRDASNIVKTLYDQGHDVYYVGGVVRDLLAGFTYNDIDLGTSATPQEVQNIFERRCRIIGKRFPICHVKAGSKNYDVTTFREKNNSTETNVLENDNNYSLSIAGDAYRRDFTINAFYVNVTRNHILDFFNGLEDMAKRQIVMIGDPYLRLTEDPVRIIRAIRLSAKMNFSLESSLRQAMFSKRALLRQANSSRLSDEVIKTMSSGAAIRALERLAEFDLSSLCLPQFQEFIMEELMAKKDHLPTLTIPPFRDYYQQALAKNFTLVKEKLIAQGINPDLLQNHSPTLALTLAGAAISDLRVASQHPVSYPFMLASMRAITFIELLQQVFSVLYPDHVDCNDEAVRRDISNIARVTFEEKLANYMLPRKDKDPAIEILEYLAFIFYTPCQDHHRTSMTKPMFRAAFSLYKLYCQLFAISPEQEANYHRWNKMHQEYEQDRYSEDKQNSRYRRKRVSIELSDQQMAKLVVPSLLNIEYTMLVHQQLSEQGRRALNTEPKVSRELDDKNSLKKTYSQEVVKRVGTQVLNNFLEQLEAQIQDFSTNLSTQKTPSTLALKWIEAEGKALVPLYYDPQLPAVYPSKESFNFGLGSNFHDKILAKYGAKASDLQAIVKAAKKAVQEHTPASKLEHAPKALVQASQEEIKTWIFNPLLLSQNPLPKLRAFNLPAYSAWKNLPKQELLLSNLHLHSGSLDSLIAYYHSKDNSFSVYRYYGEREDSFINKDLLSTVEQVLSYYQEVSLNKLRKVKSSLQALQRTYKESYPASFELRYLLGDNELSGLSSQDSHKIITLGKALYTIIDISKEALDQVMEKGSKFKRSPKPFNRSNLDRSLNRLEECILSLTKINTKIQDVEGLNHLHRYTLVEPLEEMLNRCKLAHNKYASILKAFRANS